MRVLVTALLLLQFAVCSNFNTVVQYCSSSSTGQETEHQMNIPSIPRNIYIVLNSVTKYRFICSISTVPVYPCTHPYIVVSTTKPTQSKQHLSQNHLRHAPISIDTKHHTFHQWRVPCRFENEGIFQTLNRPPPRCISYALFF